MFENIRMTLVLRKVVAKLNYLLNFNGDDYEVCQENFKY